MTIFSHEISTMNLILWGCVIWMPAFYYVILRNETKFKKNISLGVTLPQEAREDEAVLEILTTFKKQLLWACIAITLLAIPGVFISKTGTAMTVWMIWLLLGIVVPYIPYVRSHRQLKQLKIERGWAQSEQSGGDFYVDEDDKWIWGMFYYNPNDSRLIINNRTGMNTTINLAKRSGQIIMAATTLMLLCLPLFGVWMDNMESTPVGLELNDTAIISTHTSVEYEVPFDSITYVEYVAEKPKLKRSVGTGMDTVLKGRFGTPWGSASICVDPRTLPYIYLETDEGKRYLFGSSDSAETEAVYEALTKEIKQ